MLSNEDVKDLLQIRYLRGLYCHLVDAKRWHDWGQLFTWDARLIVGGTELPVLVGRDKIVSVVSSALAEIPTTHRVFEPVIDLLSGESAAGVWPMEDILWEQRPGGQAHQNRQAGRYLDKYSKVDGAWLFSCVQLQRAPFYR